MQYHDPSSPRFRRRESLISPQCSTVVQINPTFQSEESMLQKIIFTHSNKPENRLKEYQQYTLLPKKSNFNNQFNQIKINSLNENKYKSTSSLLTSQNNNKQRQIQSIKRKYGKENVYQKPMYPINDKVNSFTKYKSQNLQKPFSTANKQNRITPKYKFESPIQQIHLKAYSVQQPKQFEPKYRSYSGSIEPKRSIIGVSQQKDRYKNQIGSCSSKSIIDQEKLRKIQQKIQNYSYKQVNLKGQDNKSFNNSSKKNVSRQYIDKAICFQMDTFNPVKHNKIDKKKKNIMAQISFEHQNINQAYAKKYGKKPSSITNQINPSDDDRVSWLQDYFRKIFTIISPHNQQSVSYKNCRLSTLPEDIKLLLGGMFAQMKIKGKSFSTQQFVRTCVDMTKSYSLVQLKKILSCQLGVIDSVQRTIDNQDTSWRRPGKLLSNSKAEYKGLVKKQNKQIIRNQNLKQTNKKPINFDKTDSYQLQNNLETFRNNKIQSKRLNSNSLHQPIIVSDDSRSVRNSTLCIKQTNKQKDDQQLLRLQKLQMLFTQHFNSNRS